MIWPRWAAACSSFSINNCVHKNERTGDNKRRRRSSSSRSRQQQRWQRQRSVQAENQLRDSLICMSTPKSSPLATPPLVTPSPQLSPSSATSRLPPPDPELHSVDGVGIKVTVTMWLRLWQRRDWQAQWGNCLEFRVKLRKIDITRGLWNIYILNNTTTTVRCAEFRYTLYQCTSVFFLLHTLGIGL